MEVRTPEITNIVANYQLKSGLNIALVARHLPLDEQIIEVKMPGVINRTVDKIDHLSQFDEIAHSCEFKFPNQCTISIKLCPTIVNLKIFNNGKIVLTGYRQIEIAYQALEILFDRLNRLARKPHRLKYRLNKLGIFDSLLKAERDRNQFNRVRRKVISISAYLKTIAVQYELDADSMLDQLVGYLKDQDLANLNLFLKDEPVLKLFKTYELLNLYDVYDQTSIIKVKTLLAHPVRSIVEQDFDLFLSHRSIDPIDQTKVEIQNINTNFKTNFTLNLETTKNLINQTTQMKADYKPTGHPAVNVKVLTKCDCLLHQNETTIDEATLCLCRKVTILIYKENGGIINGARSHAQINEAFRQIKLFFINQPAVVTHYNEAKPKLEPELLPDLLIDSNNQLFLKKALVATNLRNRQLIKLIN